MNIFSTLYLESGQQLLLSQYAHLIQNFIEPELNLITKHLQGLFKVKLAEESSKSMLPEKQKEYHYFLMSVVD